MTDVERVARDELDRIYPQTRREPDWPAVLATAGLEANASDRARWGRLSQRNRGVWKSNWRWKLVVGLAVATAAVAAAVLPTALTDRAKVNVVDGALAAVATGPVLHAVLNVPMVEVRGDSTDEQMTVIDLSTGQERPMMLSIELWYDPDRQVLHQTYASEGAVLFESLASPGSESAGRTARKPPEIEPGLAAFFQGYREALEDGAATISGPGTIDGRAVTWLRFPPSHEGGSPQDVAVDSDSYEAIATRAVCPQCAGAPPTYRIVTLQGVSRPTADFNAPKVLDSARVAVYSSRYEDITLTEAASFFAQRAVPPAESVGGLPRSGVQAVVASRHSGFPPTETNLIDSGRALTYLYGGKLEDGHFRTVPGEPYVTVSASAEWKYEFSGFHFIPDAGLQPVTRAGGGLPPEGSAAVTSSHGDWTAQLKKNGLFVEIDGSSRNLVLEAARTL